MGLDVTGESVSIDLGAAPHMLLGGATGMGKSVCLHSVILSLLLRHKSDDVQLALVDPKQVEFSPYSDIDFLFGDEVVSEATVALKLFQGLVAEMDARYATLKALGVSTIGAARSAGPNSRISSSLWKNSLTWSYRTSRSNRW